MREKYFLMWAFFMKNILIYNWYNQLHMFLNVQDMWEISPHVKKKSYVKSYINAGNTCGISSDMWGNFPHVLHIKKYMQQIIIIIVKSLANSV
ncbi:unnamed protein product [Blepharisma stoltei]|uniref:Maturase K n=1 Tax=Blepharisma stoltei TaxID=1481888 RepID=A0AAU9K5Q8_9CILI|nr:unnamed protein product [Blepharisma stoltei]